MSFSSHKGLTVIELLISVSIMTIIMTTVLFGYRSFGDNLGLTGAREEMAINIRQAQTYGLSVKEVSAGGGQFNTAYGVSFDIDNPTYYVIFVDKDGDSKYDAGSGACGTSTTECIERITFKNGVTISQFCDAVGCPPSNPSIRSLHITFVRPNPDARINFSNAGGGSTISSAVGKIVMSSPQGTTRSVTVESTGQISVQ
jgi:Tfp pilus assembly protein FimT